MPRILLASPAGDDIKSLTGADLTGLRPPAGVEMQWMPAIGSAGPASRNFACETALRNGFDALMLIDPDQAFPPFLVSRLWDDNKDVVGCLYRIRSHPFRLGGCRLGGWNGGLGAPDPDADKGLLEYDMVPSGLMMIRRHVLEGVGYPWFARDEGTDFAHSLSEEQHFCRRAIEEGFEVWADCDLSAYVGHLALMKLTWRLDGVQEDPLGMLGAQQ
jgi:hypothetical protein